MKAAALVPFADMINHAGPRHANAQASWDTARSVWLVKSVAPIRTGDEVLIAYGDADNVHPAGRGGSGNAWLLQRYGFVQPGPSNADSVVVTLLLGSSAPLPEAMGGDEGVVRHPESAVDRMSRRALNRALFDAVEDSHKLRLRHPETTSGKKALRSLILHAVARVVPDPARRLDSFATAADIAERLEAEINPQEPEQQETACHDASPLKRTALRYALLLVEGWLHPYSSLSSSTGTGGESDSTAVTGQGPGESAGASTALRDAAVKGRDEFCEPSGSMRDVRSCRLTSSSVSVSPRISVAQLHLRS